ncbi:MAG: hypothetical protein JSR41_08570 [Proteobacteria bacterium]|nr:hypothetical protein [Pseudomonadota bacterium]
MNSGPRTPPRFVPTLTTVVDLSASPPELAPVPSVPVEARPVIEAESAPASFQAEPLAPRAPAPPAFAALTDADAFRIEEDLLHRVLQRVDLSLEERLTEAVSAAVQQQLDAMLPRLRGEIETVLRSLVVEALARELSENTGSAPGSGAPALG